jgi:hypothetical protein
VANNSDRFPIAGRATLSHHYPIGRPVPSAHAPQSDFDHTGSDYLLNTGICQWLWMKTSLTA